jgi:hypothetical protein
MMSLARDKGGVDASQSAHMVVIQGGKFQPCKVLMPMTHSLIARPSISVVVESLLLLFACVELH